LKQQEQNKFIRNEILRKLLNTGDIFSCRTLLYIIEQMPVAYITEYKMHSVSGDFNWYVTWKHEDATDIEMLKNASIFIHDARARLYFPAFLDTRIPPANRDGLEEILNRFSMTEYDKFELIKRSKGLSPIKAGCVEEIEAVDCWMQEIHAINEIWDRYCMSLAESIEVIEQPCDGMYWKLP